MLKVNPPEDTQVSLRREGRRKLFLFSFFCSFSSSIVKLVNAQSIWVTPPSSSSSPLFLLLLLLLSPLLLLSRSRIELWGWDIPGLTTDSAAAMICWATRHWLQRCVCGGGGGRDERARAGRSFTDRGSVRARGRFHPQSTRTSQTSPGEKLHLLQGERERERERGVEGSELSHLGPRKKPALRRGSENSPPRSTSGWVHVAAVASHFEPVSNGGPRTDLPPEECVLLLNHRTPRSICAPVREVRTGTWERREREEVGGSPVPGPGWRCWLSRGGGAAR